MATEKTPDHKRIKRAEAGRDEWKMKALSRREENEKLKIELNYKSMRFENLSEQNNDLKRELSESNKRIIKLEKKIDALKKKLSN